MYEPARRVLRPETSPPAIRGRTIQKRVSSTRKSFASGAISAVTITRLWSGESFTVRTVPTSTDLCLIFVFPASIPSALRNSMVIEGPRSRKAFTAMPAPTSAATMGTIQTSCSVRGLSFRATARGTSSGDSGGGGISVMSPVHRVPDETRVEAFGGEHREDHHRAEEDRAGAGVDRREGLQLHERDRDRPDV